MAVLSQTVARASSFVPGIDARILASFPFFFLASFYVVSNLFSHSVDERARSDLTMNIIVFVANSHNPTSPE